MGFFKKEQPDTAQPNSCPECHATGGRHNKIRFSRPVWDAKRQKVLRYAVDYKKCPRA